MQAAYGGEEILPADISVTSDGILNENIYLDFLFEEKVPSDLLEPKAGGVLLMPNIRNLQELDLCR